MGHFDDKFLCDILMAGIGWKFVLNMPRLVIQLLNCTTGLSNLTERVWHWLPWPCFHLELCFPNVLLYSVDRSAAIRLHAAVPVLNKTKKMVQCQRNPSTFYMFLLCYGPIHQGLAFQHYLLKPKTGKLSLDMTTNYFGFQPWAQLVSPFPVFHASNAEKCHLSSPITTKA